jgi:hypothetical protein
VMISNESFLKSLRAPRNDSIRESEYIQLYCRTRSSVQ